VEVGVVVVVVVVIVVVVVVVKNFLTLNVRCTK
jgi:hypothetical protein